MGNAQHQPLHHDLKMAIKQGTTQFDSGNISSCIATYQAVAEKYKYTNSEIELACNIHNNCQTNLRDLKAWMYRQAFDYAVKYAVDGAGELQEAINFAEATWSTDPYAVFERYHTVGRKYGQRNGQHGGSVWVSTIIHTRDIPTLLAWMYRLCFDRILSLTSSSKTPTGNTTAVDNINSLRNTYPVLVFSKTYCPHCTAAKELIKGAGGSNHLHVVELDVDPLGNEQVQALQDITNQTTVPNIFFGGKHYGGADDIRALGINLRTHIEAAVAGNALGITPDIPNNSQNLSNGCAEAAGPKQFSAKYPLVGPESLMSKKAHGSSPHPVQNNLRYGVDRSVANNICSFNRHLAEPRGAFQGTSWLPTVNHGRKVIYYDSVTGKPLFVAPRGRSFNEFIKESRHHGWPSFRDSEVIWDNVRCLKDGECVSVDGTHLGHNLPAGGKKGRTRNRYCINLVSVAGSPV